MYKIIDCDYNKSELLKLFILSNKANVKSLYEVVDDIKDNEYVVDLFRQFKIIPHNKFNIALGEFQRQVLPYISPGNNGLIIFPLSGSIEFNFYSYGEDFKREQLSPYRVNDPEEISTIRKTLKETLIIEQKPVAINGLITHDYRPLVGPAVAMILKIPLSVDWQDILLIGTT